MSSLIDILEFYECACRTNLINNFLLYPPILIKRQATQTLFSINRKHINVNVHLLFGLSYVAGGIIQGTVEIDNPQNIRIKRVDCIIEQTLQVENDHARNTIVNDTLPTIKGGTEKHIEGTFEIRLPENMLPTFTFDKIKKKLSPRVIISYPIKFEICVVDLLTDFSVTEPLIISIDLWKHENDGTITLIDRAQTPEFSSADNQ